MEIESTNTSATADNRGQPVYVGYATFETFVNWLGEMDPIPRQVDRSLWGDRFSGGNGAQLMVGLRFMGLLDGAAPTEPLLALAKAEPDQQKGQLRNILRTAYGAYLVDHLAEMTPQLVDEKLRELGTTSATHRRALSFFVNAAKAAGVSMQPSVGKRARKRPLGAGAKSTKARNKTGTKPPISDPPLGNEQPDTRPSPSPSPSPSPPPAPPPNGYPVVYAVVGRLPPKGGGWSQEKRRQWLDAITAAIDLEVTVQDIDDES